MEYQQTFKGSKQLSPYCCLYLRAEASSPIFPRCRSFFPERKIHKSWVAEEDALFVDLDRRYGAH
jgi:hypothetical protein